MPGHSKERFIDLKEEGSEELICGICLDVLNDPKVVKCCGKMYCNDCITEWLKKMKNCPNDRQNLSPKSLNKPPLIVNNMIMKLKISCDFADNGCKTIVTFDELDKHRNECKFSPNYKCIDCGSAGNTTHNCILNLKDYIKCLKDEILKIETQNSANYAKYFDQKLINYDLIAENNKLKNEMSLTSMKIDTEKFQKHVINSAKEWIILKKQPIIIHRKGFKNSIKNKLFTYIERSIKESEKFFTIAEGINKRLTSLNDPKDVIWHVIAMHKNAGDSDITYNENYINLIIGDLRIEIWANLKAYTDNQNIT